MDPRFERLTLPANLHSLQTFRQFVRSGAENAALPAAELEKLDLVLEEILVNITKYAYPPGNGAIEVAYAVDGPGQLVVEISDHGRVFNPLAADPPSFSDGLSDRPIGGLGVFLVRQLAGTIAYRREENRNTVSFRFPSPSST